MRGWIYDRMVSRLTAGWYRQVLTRLPVGVRLLDVGVGTGAALVANAGLVREKQLRIVGIDIDKAYLIRARRALEWADLGDRVELRQASVLDFSEGVFDAVYFSGSFMLIPEPVAACRQCIALLEGPHQRMYFTQTFEERRAPLLELVKPLLRWMTTIDFGRVTYESAFMEAMDSGGLAVIEQVRLGGMGRRSYRLVVARPAPPG